mmetsp:Transcript_71777/g.199161  ORF Transcript_71777/g.199161 Transcript_71777/m.199161 type:complete len:399 (+) Transcript_71777:332-1528(+)
MPDKRVTVSGAPGRLATTRSLGDYWAKPQGPPEKHIISGLPELRTIARQPGQQYLVLASDGIFGFMSSQDVVTLCVNASTQVAPSAPLSRLAHTVLCTAVNARRSDDNCTCLVVDLSRIADATMAAQMQAPMPPRYPEMHPGSPPPRAGPRPSGAELHPATLPMPFAGARGAPDDPIEKSPKGDSDVSLSSIVAPDEVCWCPWCWRQNREGHAENVVLGSFERWRLHMHDQHFDKLGEAYGSDEVVPCYWCCRPCVTKKGQSRTSNRLPFWGSHERVCRENPNKPALPSQARSSGSSSSLGADGSELRWHEGSSGRRGMPPPQKHPHERHQEPRVRHRSGCGGGYGGGSGAGRRMPAHRPMEAVDSPPSKALASPPAGHRGPRDSVSTLGQQRSRRAL